eukprot:12155519-Ditylum_brightwellii.AAC.1
MKWIVTKRADDDIKVTTVEEQLPLLDIFAAHEPTVQLAVGTWLERNKLKQMFVVHNIKATQEQSITWIKILQCLN